ncbi:MAG: 3-hydroxyacyl-ACP dehydratase FabZ family protein [Candidatus Aminicenantales bacterium]|jgi:3-hydroxyacyl-[acyl-carrier-protein] dehydratase
MRFLFVDRILELEPGKSIKAEYHISGDQDFFRDHFPGFPVVPGVLLTEMMAQAAGKCLDAEGKDKGKGKAMLAQIRSASFREWVRPGATALITAEIRTSQAQYATAVCSIKVNGAKVCTADLLFSFLPLGEFAPGYRDEVLESFLASRQSGGG